MSGVRGKFVLAIALSMVLSGCGITNKEKFADFTNAYKKADYCKAADKALDEKGMCEKAVDDVNPADFDMDEQLNGGTALFLAKRAEVSSKFFENAIFL